VAVERREVFDLLPRALPAGPNQQQERLGLRDFLGELGQPEARAQRDRRKEDLCRRLNPGQPRAHGLGEGRVPGVERQEYAHLMPSSELPALPEQSLSLMALSGIRMVCTALWVLTCGRTGAHHTVVGGTGRAHS
jgi:hypothetical protein